MRKIYDIALKILSAHLVIFGNIILNTCYIENIDDDQKGSQEMAVHMAFLYSELTYIFNSTELIKHFYKKKNNNNNKIQNLY